jgi:hypothetical protein
MENVQYVADSLIATKLATKFKAIKTFTLEDDILIIEMGDGRKFISPLKELHGTYYTGSRALKNSPKYEHGYNLKNSEGKQIKLRFGDWSGFSDNFGIDERRVKMFEIIESAPNVKKSFFEKIKLFVSIIALLMVIMYFIL